MQNSFRWYGPNDPVKLTDIRQANAEYVVTSLHQIPYGEKWSKNDKKKRINFIHLRNVKKEKDRKSFYESNHLNGDVDFVRLIKLILKEEKRRSENKKVDIPMRPDNGHCLLNDQYKKSINPGYTAIGRMMGLSELRGIIKAVS